MLLAILSLNLLVGIAVLVAILRQPKRPPPTEWEDFGIPMAPGEVQFFEAVSPKEKFNEANNLKDLIDDAPYIDVYRDKQT